MKVLVIEDQHKIAQAIKRGLQDERYVVDVEYDFDEGLAMSQRYNYDALIVDRMLPGGDGVEIVKKLRSDGSHVPILLLTAKGQLQDKTSGLDAGADDYLVKPFAFEELLARLRALLRRPKQTFSDGVLKIDDLELNMASYTVRREKRAISLSSTEFALLRYLMRNAGKVLSKDQIIEQVWDFDADILPNTVEVYIGYLRKKIDRPSQKKLIHTIRGFGYRFGDVG